MLVRPTCLVYAGENTGTYDIHYCFLQECEAFDQILGRLLNAGLLSQARELADIFNHNSIDLTIVLVSMKACFYMYFIINHISLDPI